jgi:integrase
MGETLSLRWEDIDFKNKTITVTKNTALKVESPYYGKDTTEARLQYEWTDPVTNIKNSRTITVKNPQVYEDESMYTFGTNAFKDISVNTTITVTYKTYYTNGIQEYTTDKRTILIQPIKGLK